MINQNSKGDRMTLEQRFEKFNTNNPKVYYLFKRFTMQAINRGAKKMGAQMIIERIRWYTSVETTGDIFKINNDYAAYYARLFMREHPQHDGFFRTRTVEGEK